MKVKRFRELINLKTGGDCMMIDVDGDKGVDDDTVLRR